MCFEGTISHLSTYFSYVYYKLFNPCSGRVCERLPLGWHPISWNIENSFLLHIYNKNNPIYKTSGTENLQVRRMVMKRLLTFSPWLVAAELIYWKILSQRASRAYIMYNQIPVSQDVPVRRNRDEWVLSERLLHLVVLDLDKSFCSVLKARIKVRFNIPNSGFP